MYCRSAVLFCRCSKFNLLIRSMALVMLPGQRWESGKRHDVNLKKSWRIIIGNPIRPGCSGSLSLLFVQHKVYDRYLFRTLHFVASAALHYHRLILVQDFQPFLWMRNNANRLSLHTLSPLSSHDWLQYQTMLQNHFLEPNTGFLTKPERCHLDARKAPSSKKLARVLSTCFSEGNCWSFGKKKNFHSIATAVPFPRQHASEKRMFGGLVGFGFSSFMLFLKQTWLLIHGMSILWKPFFPQEDF